MGDRNVVGARAHIATDGRVGDDSVVSVGCVVDGQLRMPDKDAVVVPSTSHDGDAWVIPGVRQASSVRRM